MDRKIIFCFALIIFSLSFRLAYAEIKINEFVSDPASGAEWIELWNDSSAEADLSGFSWTELASPGGETEHEGSPRSLAGTLGAQGFFVIEVNNALNNTGDSIGLYNGGSLIDRVSFGNVSGYTVDLDAPAKGTSGALVSGDWQSGQTPTKGAPNSGSSSNTNSSTNTNESTNTGSSGGSSSLASGSGISTAAKIAPSGKLKAEISVRTLAYVGIPLSFQGRLIRGGEQVYESGEYFWNFGDGDFRQVRAVGTDKFSHTYYYPGDYTVVFEHYENHFTESPDVWEKVEIKVVAPQVMISRTGDGTDMFVELWNKSTYEADLSGWMLAGYGKTYTMPKNTKIGANKKVLISGRITGFNSEDKAYVKLLMPGGENLSFYSPPAPAPAKRKISTLAEPLTQAGETPEVSAEESVVLAANISSADLNEENSRGLFSSFGIPLISLFLVASGAFAVYLIRQTRPAADPGSEFEILDE